MTRRSLRYFFFSRQPLQNRVPGNACERRRWRIQRAGVGAAVETARVKASIGRFGHRKRGQFEPFCPCHRKSLETAGLQGFFFALLRAAHGLLCRILMRKNEVNFPSGGIRSQRFRLHHHQNSIKILSPAEYQPELFFVFCGTNFAHPSSCSGGHFGLYLKSFGDPVQPCCIFLDIVELSNLRG